MDATRGPVLVTGASSGIGRSVTELLSERGCAVFATYRRASDRSPLTKLPGVMPVRLDVTRDDQVRQAMVVIRKQKSGLFGLVNNAGIADLAPLIDVSVDDLVRAMQVNFCGVHRMVRACYPFLRASRGRIVNISSINGVSAVEFGGAYSASKFALEAYTDVLREELSGVGIRVSVIEPGGFRSEIVTNMIARRKSPTATSRMKEASIRDRFLKFMTEFAGKPEARDRSIYPDPRPVAEAVVNALFSDSPKPRVMVGNKDETDWAVANVLRLLSQLNESSAQPATTEDLLARLRKSTS